MSSNICNNSLKFGIGYSLSDLNNCSVNSFSSITALLNFINSTDKPQEQSYFSRVTESVGACSSGDAPVHGNPPCGIALLEWDVLQKLGKFPKQVRDGKANASLTLQTLTLLSYAERENVPISNA